MAAAEIQLTRATHRPRRRQGCTDSSRLDTTGVKLAFAISCTGETAVTGSACGARDESNNRPAPKATRGFRGLNQGVASTLLLVVTIRPAGTTRADGQNGPIASANRFGWTAYPLGECGGDNTRCQTFEWFVGFRYLNLREQLHMYGERDQIGQDGIFREESGVYNIRTNNNLYGAQLGARTRHWGRKWGWEATGKAGIFGNDAQQEQYVIDYEQFPIRPVTSASTDRVAFVGELNLTGIYRLNEIWNLRAGYNAMWISGVALAPNQLDFSGELPAGNQLSSNGGVFLHGVSCGIEARW
jgi:hypothetical protein